MATVTAPLGAGIYLLSEAALLLGIDERSIARWSERTPSGKGPLIAPSHRWAFSFHDLLSLAVVAVFRQRGVTPDGIRRAISYLEEEFSTPRPLAHKKVVDALHTVGKTVLLRPGIDVTKHGQMILVETLATYLRPIEYGGDFLARLWKPTRHVALNPKIQAGRPCISGTRVTTDVVASRALHGEPPKVIADDLQITVRQVAAASKFEARLRDGQGLALVA